jgi:hypothetical protein
MEKAPRNLFYNLKNLDFAGLPKASALCNQAISPPSNFFPVFFREKWLREKWYPLRIAPAAIPRVEPGSLTMHPIAGDARRANGWQIFPLTFDMRRRLGAAPKRFGKRVGTMPRTWAKSKTRPARPRQKRGRKRPLRCAWAVFSPSEARQETFINNLHEARKAGAHCRSSLIFLILLSINLLIPALDDCMNPPFCDTIPFGGFRRPRRRRPGF